MFLSFSFHFPDWHRCSPSSTWCIKMMDHVTMAALRGGVAVDVHFVNISRGSFLLQQDACREWDRRSGLSPPPHSQSLVLFLPACPPRLLCFHLPLDRRQRRHRGSWPQLCESRGLPACMRASCVASPPPPLRVCHEGSYFCRWSKRREMFVCKGVWVLKKTKGRGFRDFLGRRLSFQTRFQPNILCVIK